MADGRGRPRCRGRCVETTIAIARASRLPPGRRPATVAPLARRRADELDALERLGKEGTWRVGGHDLKLTNLDKVLFAADPPVTKRELIGYFARIAPTMLPHLADRPLNLQRFPNGAGAPGFWQKDIPSTAPTWLTPLARGRTRRARPIATPTTT